MRDRIIAKIKWLKRSVDWLRRDDKQLFDPPEFFSYVVTTSTVIVGSFILLVVYGFVTFGAGKQLVDVDDARYLLSAIIQALAALLAIVVTITLIGIQMVSQTYTHKIRDYFIKSGEFWRLMGLYVSTISLTSLFLMVLKELPYASLVTGLSVLLFVCCLLYLGFFIKNMPYLFSLDNLIGMILKEIVKKSFTRPTEQAGKKICEEMAPVFDIVINALNRNDYGTASFCIEKIKTFYINTLSEKITDKENEFVISSYICDEMKRISEISIEQNDERVLDLIISSLGEMGSQAAKKNLDRTAERIIGLLSFVGDEALSKNWNSRVKNVITHVSNVGKYIIDSLPEKLSIPKEQELLSVFKILENLGSGCLVHDFYNEATFALQEIRKLKQLILPDSKLFPDSLEKFSSDWIPNEIVACHDRLEKRCHEYYEQRAYNEGPIE